MFTSIVSREPDAPDVFEAHSSGHSYHNHSDINPNSGMITQESVVMASPSSPSVRREAFQAFISTIPRTWSPSVFGADMRDQYSTHESFESNFQFNWSIEQVALLNPQDFSREENESFLVEDEEIKEKLRSECEEYFNKSKILPSPSDGNNTANNSQISISMNDQSVGYNMAESSKLPTPRVGSSKARRKRSKLFASPVTGKSTSLCLREDFLATLDEDSNSNNSTSNSMDTADSAFFFGNPTYSQMSQQTTNMHTAKADSITTFDMMITGMSSGVGMTTALSPILGFDSKSRIIEMADMDDTFNRDIKSHSTTTSTPSLPSSQNTK